MGRRLKFQDFDNPVALQDTLFTPPGVEDGTNPFPPIHLDSPQAVREILQDIPNGVGFDLEFSPTTGKPTILGVANEKACAGLAWDADLCREVIATAQAKGVPLVGHSVVGADRPVTEKAAGIETSLGDWYDTIIPHYLCNSDLCKTPGKDEDDDDSGAMGFMNLWTMASIYTRLPQWKICRGKACAGPCPVHNPKAYCAVDSFAAGPVARLKLDADLRSKRIPAELVKDLTELSDICDRMQRQGIAIDWDYVAEMEAGFEERKMDLFPHEIVNGSPVYENFNPKSNIQVLKYFNDNSIKLESASKEHVRKALEKAAKAERWEYTIEKGNIFTFEEGAELEEPLELLWRLDQFKNAGKGLTSWFNDRYKGADGLIHPRFIVPGTSLGRLASSGPNFQNIPARGFGALVRRAIIARFADYDIVKVDYSQLELRMVLYLAGVDPKDIGADAFKWLVSKAEGKLDRAAQLMADTPRQVAKSVAHGNSYLESFKLFTYAELDSPYVKKLVDAGALRLYTKKHMPHLRSDWEFRGKVVGFTGKNLAERLFGDATFESRRKALEIQEDIFNRAFPQIREWQRKILAEVEDNGYVRSATGRYLPLAGTDEDVAKVTAAMHGQGTSADFVQEKMLRFNREASIIPLLQVHDELDWEVPKDWSDAKVIEHLQIMIDESYRLPGFVSALKMKRGPNWLEDNMKQVYPA